MWELRPGEAPRAVDPGERVPFVAQAWFYADGTPDKAAAGQTAAAAWGLTTNMEGA